MIHVDGEVLVDSNNEGRSELEGGQNVSAEIAPGKALGGISRIRLILFPGWEKRLI